MISLEGVVRLVLYLVVAGLILYLLHFLIGYAGLPEPFAKVAKVILMVVAVLIVVGLLLSLVGGRPIFGP